MPCGPRGWTQFDGALGRTSSDRDWAAWCLSAVAAGQLAILSNRQQVAAFDLPTSRRKWAQQFNDPRGFPATWNWAPMPPLVVEQRIYVRRIPRLTGPELVCLDRETGRVLWSSRPGDHVACGPFWLRGSLVAVTADSTEPSFPANPRRRKVNAKQRVFHLHLTTFAPDDGHVLAKKPLVRLRDHWYGVLPCRATPVRNDLLITSGGVTLLVRLDGEIRWLRRQSFAWKQGESPRHDVYHGPPLVADDRVFTFQPGVERIECLDLETGRRVWHSEIPKTTRVVGLAKERLIVEAASKLLALHTDGGKIAWQDEPEGLTQAYLCGGLGGLAFVDRATLPLGGWRFELVWLDPSDGDVVQRHPLTEFPRTGRQPYVPQCGPFLQVGERLFVAVAEQHPRPTDRELFELLPTISERTPSRE
jgi:outer membrane protein assembly factor BamB